MKYKNIPLDLYVSYSHEDILKDMENCPDKMGFEDGWLILEMYGDFNFGKQFVKAYNKA